MILPGFVQQSCWHIRRGEPTLAPGGQYLPGQPSREEFEGAVLPLSADDLRRAPPGTYTAKSRKLYTTHTLPIGTEVETGGEIYTVTGRMDYGSIHNMSRYTLDRKG